MDVRIAFIGNLPWSFMARPFGHGIERLDALEN